MFTAVLALLALIPFAAIPAASLYFDVMPRAALLLACAACVVLTFERQNAGFRKLVQSTMGRWFVALLIATAYLAYWGVIGVRTWV